MVDLPPLRALDEQPDGMVAAAAQAHLRALLLDGTLSPGLEFSQVELARALGISRTPLREALRRLQEEGLVEAEPNRKARVTAVNVAELDAVYASRICLEAVAIAMTAQRPRPGLIDELTGLCEQMEAHGDPDDIGVFQPLHTTFHRLLVSAAPPLFLRPVHQNQDRAERYWRLLHAAEPGPHVRRDREHRQMVAAIAAADPAQAALGLARHLARTALTLVAYLAPEADIPATRAAVASHTGDASPAPGRV